MTEKLTKKVKSELLKETFCHNQTRSEHLLFLAPIPSRKNADACRASQGRDIIV